jgi:DNA end-binding protein Ku
MPRPVWTGAISFGLVTIPVKLFAATESHTVSFHQYRRGTGERIHHRRVAEDSGEEVPYDEIVKGYEVEGGEHVLVEPGELDAVDPGRARVIEIEDFVDLADEGSARPYELLRRAMDDAGRVAIARFVMRGKQHLAAVRSTGGKLVLETMHFADEVRDGADIDELSLLDDVDEPAERELRMARGLIDSLTTDWDPAAYRDTYRERVLELIERKAGGEDVVVEGGQEPAEVVDLMAALERSVSEARQRRGPDDLDSLSKKELYDRAQERDIEGRSSMTRDELVAALREAS